MLRNAVQESRRTALYTGESENRADGCVFRCIWDAESDQAGQRGGVGRHDPMPQIEFVVIDTGKTTMLGLDACEKLDLIQIDNAVE